MKINVSGTWEHPPTCVFIFQVTTPSVPVIKKKKKKVKYLSPGRYPIPGSAPYDVDVRVIHGKCLHV